MSSTSLHCMLTCACSSPIVIATWCTWVVCVCLLQKRLHQVEVHATFSVGSYGTVLFQVTLLCLTCRPCTSVCLTGWCSKWTVQWKWRAVEWTHRHQSAGCLQLWHIPDQQVGMTKTSNWCHHFVIALTLHVFIIIAMWLTSFCVTYSWNDTGSYPYSGDYLVHTHAHTHTHARMHTLSIMFV